MGQVTIIYGVKRSKLFEMREEIDKLNKEYAKDIKILLGVEANVMVMMEL